MREGSRDHKMIKARMEEELGVGKVLMEMNANVALFRRYELERRKVFERERGGARGVVVACNQEEGAEEKILEEGFDLNRCGLDFEYYGAGVYLACDCKLSHSYAAQSAVRSMLLVRVACGRMYEREPVELSPEYQAFVQGLGAQRLSSEHAEKLRRDKIRELLRKPSNRSCPDGHHSQVGVDMSGRRKSKTEVVVNRSFQAFPAYRITYQLEHGAALPSPRSAEGKGALQTLDEYLAPTSTAARAATCGCRARALAVVGAWSVRRVAVGLLHHTSLVMMLACFSLLYFPHALQRVPPCSSSSWLDPAWIGHGSLSKRAYNTWCTSHAKSTYSPIHA